MSEAIEIAHGPFGRVALLDMDRGLVRHAHPHCHVLLKVEGDDTQFMVGDRIVSLTDDQAVLVNAWETHAYVHDPQRDKAVILALYIEPAWLGAFRRNWVASGAPGFFADPVGPVTRPIRQHARDLASEMIHAPGSPRIQDELLSGLMVAALERFTAWREVGTSLREMARRSAGDYRIRRAIARMRAAPGLSDGVDILARDAGLSRAHFYRLFEQSTGAPPHVFLNGIRIERAVTAILEGRYSLADFGADIGFAAPGHFSRFFRDHSGVTVYALALAFIANASYGPLLIYLNESFPTAMRATGTGLSWNVGFALGGILPTFVSLAAGGVGRIPTVLAIFAVGVTLVYLAGAFITTETRGNLQRM